MADEILGSAYELITELAIRDFSNIIKKGESMFTQTIPAGVAITPDITVGTSSDNPRVLIQVHHTQAERASEKKFWRNIGEYVDARIVLGGNARILTIAFDSGQKRKLSIAADKLMDGFLEVDRQPFGKELLAFAKVIEAEIEKHSTKEDERLRLVEKLLKGRSAASTAMKAFGSAIEDLLLLASKAGANWFATYATVQSGRGKPRIPKRKLTTLRRALGRFLPVDDEAELRRLLKSVRTEGKADWPQYLIDVGIAKSQTYKACFTNPCPAGSKVSKKMESDPAYEVWRMTELFDDDTIVFLWKKLRGATASISQACAAIRSADEFPLFHKFVVEHYDQLITPTGMAQALSDCYKDPDSILGATVGLRKPEERGVWLFDYVMTIIKAQTGKQQGYGYTRLDVDAKTGLGTGIGPHASLFASREKPLRKDILQAFATVLADKLESVTKRWVRLALGEISSFGLTARFEDGVYKSSKFDPPLCLITRHLSSLARNTRHSTFLTGFVGKGATTCDVLTSSDTLIFWQSASSQGDDHKTKELTGRIGMLRVQQDKHGRAVAAPYKRFVLVLDGTWKEEQLDRLATAGFDAIYYVDEIDALVKALKSKP